MHSECESLYIILQKKNPASSYFIAHMARYEHNRADFMQLVLFVSPSAIKALLDSSLEVNFLARVVVDLCPVCLGMLNYLRLDLFRFSQCDCCWGICVCNDAEMAAA